jgi:hypothetical protein
MTAPIEKNTDRSVRRYCFFSGRFSDIVRRVSMTHFRPHGQTLSLPRNKVPSVGIDPPTAEPSNAIQTHKIPNVGAVDAAIPNTAVKNSVELNAKDRPEMSLSVPQAIEPTIIPAFGSLGISTCSLSSY